MPQSRDVSPSYLPRPRRPLHWGAFLKAVAAVLLVALAASCASMTSLTERTSESPAEPWVPPAKQAKPASAPAPAPVIPDDLRAPGRAWTLADIVGVGLANSPQTRSAWDAARAASAGVSLSYGEYLPQVALTLPGSKSKMAYLGGKFVVNLTTLTPTAALNLLLFDFGGREADIQAARRALDAANWTENAVFQNVILGIETVYYQYLSAQALLEAQEANRKGAQANFDAANERHRAGVATVADVLQAKTALSTIDLQIVTTRGLIQTLHGALASAMGLPAESAFEVSEHLPESVPLEAVTKQVDLCIKEAESRRPDLAAARALVSQAEAGVRKARSTFFPTFSLTGNIGRIYYSGNPVSNPFYSVSVNVSLPFLFGLQQYSVLAAKAQTEIARDQEAELARGIDLQVWTSFYGVKTAEQKIRTAGDLNESARASYDVALGRYKEGVGSILDLLAAESALEAARVELVQAKSDWFLALVQFTHDTGALAPPAPAKPGLQ